MDNIIHLSDSSIFDRGGLRQIFSHPYDDTKIIKVTTIIDDKQNDLEIAYYEYLNKQKISYNHISRYFGRIKTNLGDGVVFEKITNYDGSKCLDLNSTIEQKLLPKELLQKLVEELEQYLKKNNILFYDVSLYNLLCQEYEKDKYKLVIIDGLGGRYKKNFNFYLRLKLKFFMQRKIKEQWTKFLRDFLNKIDIFYDEVFSWDSYSDQPHVIKNRAFKKRVRSLHLNDFLKMIFTSIIILPLATLVMKFFRGKNKTSYSDLIGIGVNLDKDDGDNIQQKLVQELGVKNLIIRMPLNDVENIDRYVEFARSFGEKNILINIIQNRENLTNHELLRKNLEIIFAKFLNISSEFQIGTTINRLKWEIFSIKEDYIPMFEIAQNIRDEKFPSIKLLGPSVIDFEYYYNARAMFNTKKIRYDITSALLYVDRRGSPKNRQYGIFDLKNKIDLLYSLVQLSPKTKSDDIYITEVNWPIKNTAPYAPTSEKECVSCEDYTGYMLDYFKIARDSGKIKRVYWHQLIAPGYGLVDNRDGEIVKYPQFDALKELLK